MSTPTDIKRRLEQNWIELIKSNSGKLGFDSLQGSSPPSVFVGHFGYPKISIGPMIPRMYGDTTILDKTELWAGKSIEEIANYRLSLIRGKFTMNVHYISGKHIENLQDLVMSARPVDSEATFERRPLADTELQKERKLNIEAAPFGLSAPLKTFKTSSLSADHRIESAYYDNDLRAHDAIIQMYIQGVPISTINKVLSMGMLGQKKGRKLVPTMWSITITDDVISSRLIKANEINPTIDVFEVTQYSHLGNYYSIILIPEDIWSFEMIESWFTNSGQIATGVDYEDTRGLDHYPTIAGAYFAARLSIAEHLGQRKRKAAALVLREIHPEYVIPLGVWQIREGVREALKKPPQRLETFDSALTFASANLSISKHEIERKSKLWKICRSQTRITDFA